MATKEHTSAYKSRLRQDGLTRVELWVLPDNKQILKNAELILRKRVAKKFTIS